MFDDNLWHDVREAEALDAAMTFLLFLAGRDGRLDETYLCTRSIEAAVAILERYDLVEDAAAPIKWVPFAQHRFKRINNDRWRALEQYIMEGGCGPQAG